jgi:hypothetical protein
MEMIFDLLKFKNILITISQPGLSKKHQYYTLLHNRSASLFLLLLLTVSFSVSCSILDSDDESTINCILSEIKFDEFNSLMYQTLSGGRVYNVSQQFSINGESTTQASFQFNYSDDLITVIDQNNPNSLFPFMNVKLVNGVPVEVIKFFSGAGVILYHEISYPNDDRIRIDMTREASTGDILYVGYSVYHLNSDRNVVRNERYRADENDPSQFTKIGEQLYTYDNNPNPQKNLYLPLFTASSFPDATFFSSNNIQIVSQNGQSFEFLYEYGENNEVVSQTLPSGQSLQFGYANCSG